VFAKVGQKNLRVLHKTTEFTLIDKQKGNCEVRASEAIPQGIALVEIYPKVGSPVTSRSKSEPTSQRILEKPSSDVGLVYFHRCIN
jgi:hypothetical protein